MGFSHQICTYFIDISTHVLQHISCSSTGWHIEWTSLFNWACTVVEVKIWSSNALQVLVVLRCVHLRFDISDACLILVVILSLIRFQNVAIDSHFSHELFGILGLFICGWHLICLKHIAALDTHFPHELLCRHRTISFWQTVANRLKIGLLLVSAIDLRQYLLLILLVEEGIAPFVKFFHAIHFVMNYFELCF